MDMIFLALFVVFFLFTPSLSQNSVTVSMDAKWANTPFVAEISEFLAAEDMTLFWRYLDGLSPLVAENKLAPTEDEEQVYSAVLAAARPLLSPSLLPLLLLSLSSRAYSPTVEMNHQLDLSSQSQLSSFPCPATSAAWTLVGKEPACSAADLESLIKSQEAEGNETDVMLLRTDKVYPGKSDSKKVAVLFGDMRDKGTHEMHSLLKRASNEGKVKYVFRHRVVKVDAQKTRLSGYGLELAIKSTEYKAMDDSVMSSDKKASGADAVAGFDFSVLRSRHPNLTKELGEFRQYLLDSATEMVDLKAWQLQDLSFQAAQRISAVAGKGDEAIATLVDLSQNFPLRAHSLSQVSVTQSFRSEVQRLQSTLESQLGLAPGSCALFVNGYLLNDHDPISLLELLRRESRVMEGLHSLGVTGVEINKVMRTPLLSSETSSKFALDIREMPLAYLNDLEDGSSRYYGWPSSVRSMLEQTLPGMLRRVAKNLFNLVMIMDPGDVDTWQLLRYAQAFVVHAAPVRIGVVWCADEGSVGELMARAFEYTRRSEDEGLAGLEFLIQIINDAEKDKESGGKVTRELIERLLQRRFSKATADRVLGTPEYGSDVTKAREYLSQSGLSPKLPHVLMNGVPLDRRQVKDMFEETVIGAILEQTTGLQRDVYEGRLTDHHSTIDYLMTRPDIVPRLNQLILNSENTNHLNLVRKEELSVQVANSLVYLMKNEERSEPRSVSVWLAVDLNQPASRLCVYNALKVLRSSSKMRLALVHVGSEPKGNIDIALVAQSAMKFLSAHTARLFITKLVKEENVEALQKGTKTLKDLAVSDMDFEDFQKKMNGMDKDYRKLHNDFGTQTLQLSAKAQSAIIVNGKVLGPLTDKQLFDNEDFRLLERVTGETGGADALTERLRDLRGSSGGVDLSDLSMRVYAILQAANAAPETSMASVTSKRRHAPLDMPAFAASSESVIRLHADVTQPAFEFVAVVDPLTREAQKIAGILAVLRESVNCNIHIIFNCKPKLSESPLKNFYRLVWSPRPDHPSWGRGVFTDMPGAPLLTLGVDAPHAWMVTPVRSAVDLDNIRLLNVGRVSAHFQLEHLLLEGHCVDTVTGQPPRGLQFTLAAKRGEADVDTIVMANLGYFQMKANPGAWFLQLRQGRSKDIYDISGHAYTDNMPDSPEVIAVIDSLRSKIIRVRVAKKADKLDAKLLVDDDDGSGGVGSGIWSSISSAFGGQKKKSSEAGDVLNIFSVASGHLYERFLRIMMLSVLKHTKQPVKFWFLKNYLSPSFKDFIPHMAKAYKFDYELVQYKWPRWLQHQTEKQRIIWGYKILFLDVLFPLDVHKIIFVDADQIVRTNLQELADFDLEGAPYGYTPFCDSRREMDGFRFWKSGYWAQHLGNRRYHISALYVVDLIRFRRLAAGDRLRGQYQGLSQDPNSLSNLDQDLPNNMIHQVPIKSLPQEWLWCETWCSTSELERAKTIDLCNNPQTKEPKLQAARRIVPEWTGYDEEVKRLWDKVYGSRTAAHGEEKSEEKKKDEL